MKKWLLAVLLVLVTVTAVFGFIKFKTGLGPFQLLKVKTEGFQTDPAILQALATGGQPLGRWKEGLMFDGVTPMPWMKSAANWFPGTEEVQPDEIRVIFMGSSPLPRPGQMGTSVFVELGNGHHFIFDFGPGSIANYVAARVPLNQINDIYLTHLHWDHVDSVAYAYMFGAWGGRWHEKYRITGPSGRDEKHGVKYMMAKMDEMLTWHKDSFDTCPIGEGFEMDVNEFDYKDDGGVVYDKDGVKIIHWRQSHSEDGASAYRLDWNGMCIAFTGDGRPNSLTLKYAKGCDLVITEIYPELVAVSSGVSGVMPLIGRITVDQAHNSAYAAGYLYNQLKPRMAMGTHTSFDNYSNAETIAEVRENWKGPFHFGAPDGVVVNLTKDKVWVRDGVLPAYPNAAAPQFDMAQGGGGLAIPAPKNLRSDVQSQDIRDLEINPDLYYPKGYKPDLILDWPSPGKPVFLPESKVPEQMKMKKK